MNKKHLLLPVLAAALGVGSLASTLAAATDPAGKTAARTPAPRIARHVEAKLTRRLRAATWHWETVMGVRRSRSSAPLNTRVALRFWRRHAGSARRLAASPPNKRGWLCIHGFEGAWADSGDPYWGGLQMDRGFMSRYAPRLLLRRGWANRWTPLEQMWVAERARRSGRGYWPWPNAARICGLL